MFTHANMILRTTPMGIVKSNTFYLIAFFKSNDNINQLNPIML